MKHLLILPLLLVAAACSSLPKYADSKGGISALDPKNGRIFLYRDTWLGAALSPDIKLNGVVIGESRAGAVSVIDVPPGDYVVETKTEASNKLTFKVDAGQKRYVRFDVSMGFFVGHVVPVLVDPAVGEKAIQPLGYLALKSDQNIKTVSY